MLYALLLMLGVAAPVTIPAGTTVELRLEGGVSTRTARLGDAIETTILQPVYVDGALALPTGTRAWGRVEVLRTAREGAVSGVIGIDFTEILLPGRGPLPLDAK